MIPALVRRQMRDVGEAAREARRAADGDDLDATHKAFAALGEALDAVDAASLQDHAALAWKESAMRLGNDAFEGRTAETLEAARRVAEGMKDNLAYLEQHLGLAPAVAAMTMPPVEAAFLKWLEGLYDGYLAMGAALAGDDAAAAREAAGRMRKALAGVEAPALPDELREVWRERSAAIAEALVLAAEGTTIDSARRAFQTLSENLSAVAERFGPPGGRTLYQIHCPMAFDSAGAIWLQPDRAVRNPYFGQTMLECGSIVKVIAAPAGGEKHDHE